MFSKPGGLSRVQEFALKADYAITQPREAARAKDRQLGVDIRLALLTRKGAKVDKLFPELFTKTPEEALESADPQQFISTMTPEEAQRDFEEMMAAMNRQAKAENANTMTAEDLFPEDT